MFNDKDFMGGMFDFDGNGKTTLDEQYVAYKIYEETTKEENDFSSSYHKPAKYSYTNNNSTNSKGTKGGTIIAVVAVIISLLLLFAKCSSSNSNNNSYESNYQKRIAIHLLRVTVPGHHRPHQQNHLHQILIHRQVVIQVIAVPARVTVTAPEANRAVKPKMNIMPKTIITPRTSTRITMMTSSITRMQRTIITTITMIDR